MKTKILLNLFIISLSLFANETVILDSKKKLDSDDNVVIQEVDEKKEVLRNFIDDHNIGVDVDSPGFFGLYVSGGVSRGKLKKSNIDRDISKLYIDLENPDLDWFSLKSKAKLVLPPVFNLPLSTLPASVTAGISKGWIGNFHWTLFGKDYRVFSKNVAQSVVMPYMFREMPIKGYSRFPDSFQMIMKVATGSEFVKKIRSFLHSQVRVRLGTFWGLQKGMSYLQWGDFNYHVHVIDRNGRWPIVRVEIENEKGNEDKKTQGLFAGFQFLETFILDGSLVNNIMNFSSVDEKRNTVNFRFLLDFSYVHARKAYQKLLKGDLTFAQKYGIARLSFPEKYRGIFIEEERDSKIILASQDFNFFESNVRMGLVSSVINAYAPISFLNNIFDIGMRRSNSTQVQNILVPEGFSLLRDKYGVQEKDDTVILWGIIRRNHEKKSINYVWERLASTDEDPIILDERIYLDYSIQKAENWKYAKILRELYADFVYAYSGKRHTSLDLLKVLGDECSRNMTFNLAGTIQREYLEEIGRISEKELWNYLGQFFGFKDPSILETNKGRIAVIDEHPYGPARHRVRYFYKYPMKKRHVKLFHKFYKYKGIGGIAFAATTLNNDYQRQAQYLGSLLQKGEANLELIEFLHFVLRQRLPNGPRPSINLSLSSKNCILSFTNDGVKKILPTDVDIL